MRAASRALDAPSSSCRRRSKSLASIAPTKVSTAAAILSASPGVIAPVASAEATAFIPAAMKAVASALATGAITPGEAERIAAAVDTFVGAIDASDFDRRRQELEGASKAREAARIAESGSPRLYNRSASVCCRFAEDAANGNNRFKCWLWVRYDWERPA